MHVMLTFGALATLVVVLLIIGWLIGHGTAVRRAEKTRVRMEAKRARLAARTERRALREKTMEKLLPWRRTKER
jgi:DNA recombination-dependent growth factor C